MKIQPIFNKNPEKQVRTTRQNFPGGGTLEWLKKTPENAWEVEDKHKERKNVERVI